ncbi:MAG: 7-carboxy-7-deazaguanine synthase QueE [Magnetococcus sp. DMHC-8]
MTATVETEPLYPLCDLFASIQGEATWTGRAMHFLRFAGCPLACPWCDEPRHRDPQAVRHRTASDIVTALRQLNPDLRHLLLTGGEPLAVPGLDRLVQVLREHGYWLAMETSGVGGTVPPGLDWLTLSPKTPLPERLFALANEVKYVVGATLDEHQARAIQHRARTHPNVWVQPRFDNNQPDRSVIDPGALYNCLTHIRQSGGRIRLSLQTHKWTGLP